MLWSNEEIITQIMYILLKAQSVLEDFRKEKQQHLKSLDKYLRLVQEAETSIRNRDSKIDVETRALDKDSAQKESGFMNRSLTKVKVLYLILGPHQILKS